jgi:TonB-linked SusC/RagA family outer membrane protein
MMKKLILTVLALIAFLPAFAQTKKVSGVVRDENGDPMPGAIVVVKLGGADGTVSTSVLTDASGRYSIECGEKDYLAVHFLGYDETVVPAKGKRTIDFTLTPDSSQELEEVVVIGYGAVKKADLTGSVTNVKMAEIRNEPVLSIDQALQGRVAGMEITSTDGEPGSESVIRIRGSRSLSAASNDPLIVVDGVTDAVSSLNDINPADIEAISVLKDASATAIYGSRGANGVIIITTKGSADSSDSAQNFSLTFNGSGGVSFMPRNLDLMDAEQYGIYRNEYYQHIGTSASMNMNTPLSGLSVRTPFTNGPGTDWIGDVSRVAPFQNYNLSMNGFNGKQKFYASLSYNDEQGIIKKSGKQNFTGTLNVSNKVFKWLTIGAYLRYQYRLQDNFLTQIGGGGINYAAQYLSPLITPKDSYNPLDNSAVNIANAVVRLNENTDHTDRSMLNISLNAQAKIADPLKYKTKFSYYFFDRQRYQYNPSTLPSRTDAMGGSAYRENYGEQSLYYEQTLEYSKEFGRHHMDATLGQTFKHLTIHRFSLDGDGYIVDAVKWNNMGAVTNKESYGANTEAEIRDKLSFFGRINYNYRKRYYLTLTGRLDGASNFAANHKWGFFPSGAFKWVIIKEPWFDKVEWLDDLSLKMSLGQSGNDVNKAYRSLARLGSSSGGYPFGGHYSQAYWQSRIASPNLTWETTTAGNIALDMSVLNNRLSFSLEAYRSITTDLLLTVKTPQHTGYDDKYENIGRTSSQGIEFSVSSRNIVKRNFSWSTSFNISHNTSMVDDLGPESEVALRTAPTQVAYTTVGYRVGYPVNSFWGFQYAGVWHNQEEIDRNKITHAYANDQASTKLGYPIFIDQNHDGSLDSRDIVFLGSPDPVVYGGLQNTFRFKQLSLGVYFTYSLGGKVLNYSEFYMAGSRRTNQYAYMVNAWHPIANPESNLPRAGIFDASALPSSFLIHDSSYLRLKTLSLSYRFNIKSRVIRELEVSVSGENLYLWTNYNGFDPDVSSGSIKGYDNSWYPKSSRYVFSIQMKY